MSMKNCHNSISGHLYRQRLYTNLNFHRTIKHISCFKAPNLRVGITSTITSYDKTIYPKTQFNKVFNCNYIPT